MLQATPPINYIAAMDHPLTPERSARRRLWPGEGPLSAALLIPMAHIPTTEIETTLPK
jgi:hypothetical protein